MCKWTNRECGSFEIMVDGQPMMLADAARLWGIHYASALRRYRKFGGSDLDRLRLTAKEYRQKHEAA